LEPQDAFGEYDAELLRIENRDRFPEPLEVGMQFEGIPSADEEEDENAEFVDPDDEDLDSLIYTITDLAEDRVVLDANHPLAGIALRFWLQVTNVRPASTEEIENGRANDQIGLQVDQFEEDDYENLDDLLPPESDRPGTLH
jgi:FKBP-type peptidyl-prolyl cis-trans isomerase SlyD